MSHFNPLSPCGERLFEILHDRHEFHISIHSPHAGRDFGDGVGNDNVCISIHSPHAGRDCTHLLSGSHCTISIHSPHAGRDSAPAPECTDQSISIHSPHAGRDLRVSRVPKSLSNFNPLSPCGERLRYFSGIHIRSDFNPLSPCGERRIMFWNGAQTFYFMRGETNNVLEWGANLLFQSTLPMRGETSSYSSASVVPAISIHSPHAGRDIGGSYHFSFCVYFNPLSPCGERPSSLQTCASSSQFQSTLPMRGETKYVFFNTGLEIFQSTLPMRGETGHCRWWISCRSHFNPLSPCGERRFPDDT